MNFVLQAVRSGFREDAMSHWPTKQTLPPVGQALGPGTEPWQPRPGFGQRELTQFPKGINSDAGARQTSQHQWALVDVRTMQTKGIITRKGQDRRLGARGSRTRISPWPGWGPRGNSVVWAMSLWDPGWWASQVTVG